MFKKNDPLVESVKKIMEHNELCRRVEARLCEELGIASRKALPFEHHANYDALLEQRINEATDPSKYSEKQKKLAAVGNKAGIGGDPRKIDAPDLAGARKGHASHIEEDQLDERNEENKAKKDAYVRSLGAKSDKPNPYKFKKSVSNLMQGRKELKQMKEEDTSSSHPDFKAPRAAGAPTYKDEIKYKEEPKSEMPKNPPMPPKRPANLEETNTRGNYGVPKKKATSPEERMRRRYDNLPREVRDMLKKAPGSYEVDPEMVNRLLVHKTPKEVAKHIGGIINKTSKEATEKTYGRDYPSDIGPVRAESTHLEERAVSKAQQRFFGLVRGIQKGKAEGSEKAEKAAKEMTSKEVRKYAKTKHKGLPEKKDSEND